jgi:hypothetical protein
LRKLSTSETSVRAKHAPRNRTQVIAVKLKPIGEFFFFGHVTSGAFASSLI